MSKSKRLYELKEELVQTYDEEQLNLHAEICFLQSELDYAENGTA